MNETVLLIEVVVVFGLLLLSHKLFGKEGVIAWVGLASVVANIITAKNAEIFGLTTAIGSVTFASVFLATDILNECYGVKYARKAVYVGLFSTAVFIIISQIALTYIPSRIDYADESMQTLFSMNLRISISSMVMYFIANMTDVYLYDKIKKLTDGKFIWLRNNVSTILCNCLENFFFMSLAFYGVYDLKTICIMALSTSVIEAAVGICDTPFLYAAKKIRSENGKQELETKNHKTDEGSGDLQTVL